MDILLVFAAMATARLISLCISFAKLLQFSVKLRLVTNLMTNFNNKEGLNFYDNFGEL